jgi:Lytic transglycolase
VCHATRHRRTSTGFYLFGLLTFGLGCAGCSIYTPRFSSSGHQLLTVSKPPYTAPAGSNSTVASWYGPGFYGHRTSNGETFNQHQLTAASRTLPLGTYARVTNVENGQSVIVRVNDRGPYVRRRGIDLSEAAAGRLGLVHEGVARVRVTRLDTTASAIPDPPELASGVRVRRRHYYHLRYHRYRHGSYSGRIIRDPVGTWLLELVR